MSLIAFQPDAFQWGLQIMDAIPVFVAFPMAEQFKIVEGDQSIMIMARIADLATTPGVSLPLDPATTPQIEIYKPDGAVQVALTNMTFLDSGIYGYVHQTSQSHMKGVYTGIAIAVNGTNTGRSEQVSLFRLL